MTSHIKFTLKYTEKVSAAPAQTPTAMPQPPVRPSVDTVQSLRTSNEPHCCKRLFDLLLSPFIWAGEMLSRLFGSLAEIDPALLAKWDQVVQKNYDLPGATRTYYSPDVNECKRGKTIADHFVKAMARTQISPPFKHVFIYEVYNAGNLFTNDGFFLCLAKEAREGKFNSPETLIIFAAKIDAIKDEQAHIQIKKDVTRRDGYPIDNAKCVVLTPSESGDIFEQRVPKKLLKAFQQP